MYRPFMTCDDPKGVVDCGTIRKYKTSSHQKMNKKDKTDKPNKEEKVSKKESIESLSYDSSSLQLMEVSRGAQRLNNMIDSWSSGVRYDGSSEDIARDLLKGALDLQESLAMLRKVQEASQHVARLKREQKEKHSRQCSEQSHHHHPMGLLQRPWPSADGSSSSCREELKKVIKESLVRQNLFANTATTEGLDSPSEFFPSTNSSQSSGVRNDMLSDSSFSPIASKKERGSNLVAKLMGLDEVPPSRSVPPAIVQKQFESEKILNQKRPVFELDMPKLRKSGSMAEKVYPEKQKTLREILETTHYNGLLKKSSIPHFNDPHYKRLDDLPPIVLIKPRCKFVKAHEPVPSQDLSLRKLKGKAAPSKMVKNREGSTTNMGKQMEEHIVSRRRLTQEEGNERRQDVVVMDTKEIKPVENENGAGGKGKLHGHVSHRSQESETAVDKKAKVKHVTRKPLEKEIPKTKTVTKSQDQGEIRSAKLRMPQSVSRIDRNDIPFKKSISKTKNQNIISPLEQQRKNQMKKQRDVAEPEPAKLVAEQLGQVEADKIVDVSCKDECPEIRIITTTEEERAANHEVHVSADMIEEDCKLRHSSSGDDAIMVPKSERQNDAILAEESHDEANCSETNSKPYKEEAELKILLLTNQSFICHAEELLNLDVDCPEIPQKEETNEIANSSRLYLDCANEITERKSLQESQFVHPLLLTCLGNSRLHISLGRLVEEICDAIENLRSYSKSCGRKLPLDNIYAMMERDIKCNGVINGIWNCGWRHGFSVDEAEQVVNEIESLVLNGLIEEAIVNL